jgi:hypothetical protein
MQPRLHIEQKITAFVNRYAIYEANQAQPTKKLLAFAQQKRLAFKEKVTFYSDEQQSALAFTFRAEKVMDVHGRYIVEGADGRLLGSFRKEFKKSLLVSNWVVMDAEGSELLRVQENNVTVAVLRRYVSFVPLVGDLLDILMTFFRYHFSFKDVTSQQEVGQYKKTTLLRDHYELLVADGAWEKMDWRVFAAVGVALDALQSR